MVFAIMADSRMPAMHNATLAELEALCTCVSSDVAGPTLEEVHLLRCQIFWAAPAGTALVTVHNPCGNCDSFHLRN